MSGSTGPIRQSTDDAYAGLLPYLAKNTVANKDTGLNVSEGLGKMLASVKEKAGLGNDSATVDAGKLRQEIEGGSITGIV